MKLTAPAVATLVTLIASPLAAKEYPIGKPQMKGGMEVAAVYLQPIEMDPPDVMRAATESDVHLEADIKAAKDNKNGFSEGDWIPFLVVTYELTKLDPRKRRRATSCRWSPMTGPITATTSNCT